MWQSVIELTVSDPAIDTALDACATGPSRTRHHLFRREGRMLGLPVPPRRCSTVFKMLEQFVPQADEVRPTPSNCPPVRGATIVTPLVDRAYAARPMLAASSAARCMLDDISFVTVLCSSTAAAVAVTYSLTF